MLMLKKVQVQEHLNSTYSETIRVNEDVTIKSVTFSGEFEVKARPPSPN